MTRPVAAGGSDPDHGRARGPGATLREALAREPFLVAPVCYDALTARVIEKLGFPAAYLGGFALGAVTCLSEPLTSVAEMAAHAAAIARRIRLPLIVDGDAGFGEPLHTMRTVREFEWAGVGATHIEDQHYPKRAHYHKGVEHIISTDAMQMKIHAALQARQQPEFVLIARTDAMRTHGFAEGVARGNAYAEAGADMVMCFPNTLEEARRAPLEIRAPLVYVNSRGNRLERPVVSVDDLRAMGWRLLIDAITAPLVAYRAVKGAYAELARHGRIKLDVGEMRDLRQEIEELVGLDEYYRVEAATVEGEPDERGSRRPAGTQS